MKFCEKLDFLMNITKTTNSYLAMHISLDASHISRLRRGERRLVPDAEYLNKMSAYFIKQCIDEYQISALAEIMKIPTKLFDFPDKATEKVYHWLLSEGNAETDSVDFFLEELNSLKKDSLCTNGKDTSIVENIKTDKDISLYYGVNGKREAVLRFLSIVLEKRDPGDLLLYSDEPMDWLTEDLEFQVKWVKQLTNAISQGNHIKIIHTVSRNLDEMLEAISKWIPLYMSGAIEPYYYPKKRDGVFRRTLFVAPGKAAISVNSLDLMTDRVTNILFQEQMAVESLKEEFDSYLSFCKPLMRIFTNKNRNEYFRTLNEFEKELENTLINSGQLSLVTMPDDVARSMVERSQSQNKNELMDYYDLKRKRFLETVKTKKVTEIIKIDDILTIRSGCSKIDYSGIDDLSEITYTCNEYINHLYNIVKTLKMYDNYNVIIEKTRRNSEFGLYVVEDYGAIIKQNTKPFVIFATKESNITAVFWDYLDLIVNENKSDKKSVIKKLRKIIKKFED